MPVRLCPRCKTYYGLSYCERCQAKKNWYHDQKPWFWKRPPVYHSAQDAPPPDPPRAA